MANRPANAGAHSAGPQRGPRAAPPPVHHHGFPGSRRITGNAPASAAALVLAWAPYLIVLAGVAAGVFVIWQGSQYASRGAGLVGGALLVAAAVRLALPPRYAGLLASRGKAWDVTAYAVLGAAVLVVAASLP